MDSHLWIHILFKILIAILAILVLLGPIMAPRQDHEESSRSH